MSAVIHRCRMILPAVAWLAVLTVAGCAGKEPDAAPPSPSVATDAFPTTVSTEAAPTAAASATASPTSGAATPSSTPDERQRITVTYTQGQVSGDRGRFPVPLNEKVSIVVVSDVADEVHLHGYDVSVPVAPGAPAMLDFDATIPGVFEVELEDLGLLLLTVQVS